MVKIPLHNLFEDALNLRNRTDLTVEEIEKMATSEDSIVSDEQQTKNENWHQYYAEQDQKEKTKQAVRDEKVERRTAELKGIGGWLSFFGFILALNAVIVFLTAVASLFQPGKMLEAIIGFVISAIGFYALYLFYKTSKRFVVVASIIIVCLFVVALGSGEPGGIGATAILGSYLLFSRRVKATFVN